MGGNGALESTVSGGLDSLGVASETEGIGFIGTNKADVGFRFDFVLKSDGPIHAVDDHSAVTWVEDVF